MIDEETLKQFVSESNAIEGFFDGDDSPRFKQHLEAARYVANWAEPGKFGWIVHPQIVHEMLLKGIATFAGQYRTEEVRVGGLGIDRKIPAAAKVPYLMDVWMESYLRYWNVIVNYGSEWRHEWIRNRAWHIHDFFLCVHPFADGNGRTARLLLNGILVGGAAGWQIVRFRDRANYYAKIRDFEDRAFLPWYRGLD